MAVQNDGPEITKPASATLVDYQFHIMKIDTNGRVALATDPDDPAACPVGILQNEPAAIDREAVLRVGGTAKVMGGATVAIGRKVTCDGSGHAAAAVSGDNVIGITLEAMASGKVSEILIAHSSTIGDG